MSSVGFDIGNSSCVVTIANKGKLQVVLNNDSENETPSVVSFGDKRRRFGSEAVASLISNSASTVSQLKRLIGKDLDFIEREFIDFPFKTSADDDGEILIHVNHRGEEYRFKPVHILAMLLSHLKQMVEKNNNNQPISSCVIGVPSYFTDKERIAYLDAAEIAGLKDPQLMHEGAAIALGYRFCRSTEITDSTSNVVVVFIDIGHCDTQITVVRYQGDDDIHVLAHASDPNLGGRDFDKILFFHFAKEFNDKFKIDIIHNPKACAKLIDLCENLKSALTTETLLYLHMENLMDGKDLDGSITRDKFEELSLPLVKMICTLCSGALSDARLSIFQEYSVKLLGSGSQIPIIYSALEGYFSRPIVRMLVGIDKLVSRGCALQASRLSTNSQINLHKLHDSIPFQVRVEIYSPSLKHSDVLFHKGGSFPNTVSFKFKNVYDTFELHIIVCQNDQSRLSRVYKVRNVAVPSNQLPILEAKVGVDHCGIINLYSVALSTRQKDPTSMITAQVGPPTEPQITDVSSMGMMKADLIKIQEVEDKLVFHDKSVEAAESRRNELEAYVVETRKKLNEDMYQDVVTSSEKNECLKALDEMEIWLGDHDDESTSYVTKLESLKKIFSPIDNRQRNHEDCAQATQDFEDYIMERASANSSENVDSLGAFYIEYGRADEWLKAWKNLHELLPGNIDKGQLTRVVRDRKRALHKSCQLILNDYTGWLCTLLANRPQTSYLFEEKDKGHTSEQHSLQVDHKRGLLAVTVEGKTQPESGETTSNVGNDKDSAIIDLLYGAFLHRVAVISLEKPQKDAVNEECTRVEQWLMSKINEQDTVLTPPQIREEIDKLNRLCEDQLKQARDRTYPGNKESALKVPSTAIRNVLSDGGGTGHNLSLSSTSNPTIACTPSKDGNPSTYFDISIGKTMVGRMVFQLFMDVVPKTVKNFLELCTGDQKNDLSYVGSLVHRIIPGRLCVGGSLHGVQPFARENFTRKHTCRGVLSMATNERAPKISHGSAFIICFRKVSELDGQCVVFGEITHGMDVLERIEAVGTPKGGTKEQVVIVGCGKLN